MRLPRLRFSIPALLVAVLLVGGGLLSTITAIAVVVALREAPAGGGAGMLVREMLFWGFVAWAPLGILLAWWASRRISATLEETRGFARDQAWTEHPPRRTGARITEVRRLEEALSGYFADLRDELAAALRSRDEALVLVNAVGEGIMQIDGGGRLMRLNPAAARLLRLPGEALGQAVVSLVRQPELRALLERPLANGSAESAEVVVEGQQLLVVREMIPVSTGADGWIVLVVDLTPIRRLEDVRRDFVANVSHELKTPLTAILGYAETMQDPELPADLRRQFMEATLRNAARLQRIVDDLLDLSRIESGGWRPQPTAVDVPALARDAWVEFAERARENGVAFDVDAADAPAASADPEALRQILSNLYDNALRYTTGGGRISVRVSRCARAGNTAVVRPMLCVQVSDTGSGIPADALPRIFERFYRVDPSRSRAEGGTGLGLSIVKHMTERMGGDVVAESRLGVGTTVRITLPVAAPSLVPATDHE
ncbi:MAG TPA: ATP-binding protein [Longimicrobiales bacterium]